MRMILPAGLLALLLACNGSPAPTAEGGGGLVVGAPATHENLSVYPIRRPGATPSSNYLTLEEGLAAGSIVVTDKRDVNELLIENKSDRPVLVAAGDVVRGGQQDRSIANDFIIPPRSAPMPLSAFCVEHGRWTKRGAEDAAVFTNSSAGQLNSKELKLAARLEKNQQKVWDEVAKGNAGTAGNVPIIGGLPASGSLELVQGDENVKKAVDAYVAKLEPSGGAADAVGFAFCVNGEISTAEIFGDPAIFARQWPKLLRAAAAEALAKKPKTAIPNRVTAQDVLAFVQQERDSAKKSRERAGPAATVTTYDKKEAAIFECADEAGNVVRRQYIKK
jgi:hypothetical protein